MATKKKPKAAEVETTVEELEAPVVVVTADPVVEPAAVELVPEAQPEVFVLLELHEREDGWWGGRLTFPGGEAQTFHAPRRPGVEGAAYRILAMRECHLPLVIQLV